MVDQRCAGVFNSIEYISQILEISLSYIPNKKIYGKCDKVKREGKYDPLFYLGEGEYIQPMINNYHLVAFFLNDGYSSTKDGREFSIKTKIVFITQLSKIDHDRDEQKLYVKITDQIKRFGSSIFTISGIDTDIQSIMRGYDYSKYSDFDMLPYHMFAIEGVMEYSLNEKIKCKKC